jgi:hypothetical protein
MTFKTSKLKNAKRFLAIDAYPQILLYYTQMENKTIQESALNADINTTPPPPVWFKRKRFWNWTCWRRERDSNNKIPWRQEGIKSSSFLIIIHNYL